MFKFTSKEMSERIAKFLADELSHRHVEVVKCTVETIPIEDMKQAEVLIEYPSSEAATESLDHFSMNRLAPAVMKLAASIKEGGTKIFTMSLPLPRGAWSTFEKLGELGFRVIEQYDVNTDNNLVRIDVLYAVAS